MNRLDINLALALLFVLPSLARADVEDRIQWIRDHYYATEDASLDRMVIRLEEGGGVTELVRYRDRHGDLAKLAFTSGGDHGGVTDTFYFHEGELYFVFQSASWWSFDPDGPEGSTIDHARERRVYYSGNDAIRHLLKKVSSSDADAIGEILSATDNRSVSDPEVESRLYRKGRELFGITTREELSRHVLEN